MYIVWLRLSEAELMLPFSYDSYTSEQLLNGVYAGRYAYDRINKGLSIYTNFTSLQSSLYLKRSWKALNTRVDAYEAYRPVV